MSPQMNRREFIKIAGVGAGSLAFATPLFDFSKGEILATKDRVPTMLATTQATLLLRPCHQESS